MVGGDGVFVDGDGCEGSAAYRQVGRRLRAIRGQKRLALTEVETSSRGEFRAAVLGAYERGDRAITVARLQRLARFYDVPVDQLLPAPTLTVADQAAVVPTTIAIDLARLEDHPGAEYRKLGRYLRMIQIQRHDFNGRVLTIRHDDLRAIACILDCTPTDTSRHLTELGLRYDPPR